MQQVAHIPKWLSQTPAMSLAEVRKASNSQLNQAFIIFWALYTLAHIIFISFVRHHSHFTYEKTEVQWSNLSMIRKFIRSGIGIMNLDISGKGDPCLGMPPQNFLSSPQVPGTNEILQRCLGKMPWAWIENHMGCGPYFFSSKCSLIIYPAWESMRSWGASGLALGGSRRMTQMHVLISESFLLTSLVVLHWALMRLGHQNSCLGWLLAHPPANAQAQGYWGSTVGTWPQITCEPLHHFLPVCFNRGAASRVQTLWTAGELRAGTAPSCPLVAPETVAPQCQWAFWSLPLCDSDWYDDNDLSWVSVHLRHIRNGCSLCKCDCSFCPALGTHISPA